jgi:hypothetical protein
MLQVGFECTILMFDPAKIVHALDRAATVIGFIQIYKEPSGFLITIKHYFFIIVRVRMIVAPTT